MAKKVSDKTVSELTDQDIKELAAAVAAKERAAQKAREAVEQAKREADRKAREAKQREGYATLAELSKVAEATMKEIEEVCRDYDCEYTLSLDNGGAVCEQGYWRADSGWESSSANC